MTEEMKIMLLNVAKMQLCDMSPVQIARILNASEESINKIIASAEYQEAYAALSQEKLQNEHDLDEGWDTLEKRALDVLNDMLKWSKDPDIALRAAAVANKANRRMRGDRDPLRLPSNAGVVNLQLNQNFIQHLQVNNGTLGGQTKEDVVANAPRRDVRMLAPEKLQSLLRHRNPAEDELDALAIQINQV